MISAALFLLGFFDFLPHLPEDLIGRKIVFVANLAPAKLCGELSEGMILACDAGDNDVRVLFLDKDVPNGSTIR